MSLWMPRGGSFHSPKKRSMWQSAGITMKPGGGKAAEPVDPLDKRPGRRFQPTVVFLMGRRGRGKTLMMTAVAKHMQLAYQKWGHQRRIYSNYQITFLPEGSSDPYLLDKILANPFAYRDSLICIDEIATAFPGRRAMANVNVNFVNFLTQIRKLHCEIIFSTQFPSVVDRDLLMQVDFFVRCNAISGGKSVKLETYDWWGHVTGDDSAKAWPPVPGEHDFESVITGTDAMFGTYNTDEVIIGLRDPNRENLLEQYYEIDYGEDEEAEESSEAAEPEETPAVQEVNPQYLIMEYISGLPNTVNFNQVVAKAKTIDGTMSKQDLTEIMESAGYKIERVRNRAMAYKEE